MQKEREHSIDFVFVLILFCCFAASAFCVISVGSRVYTKTVEVMEKNYQQNTAMDYLTEKVRQNMKDGQIEVKDMEGSSVLCLHEEIEDVQYTTYIWVEDGYLREQYVRNEQGFQHQGGEKIMEMDDLTFSMEEQKLQIESTWKGQTEFAVISILGGEQNAS